MDFFKKQNAEQVAKELLQREGVQTLLESQDTSEKHKHEWELVSKTYVPPRRDVTQTNLPTETLDKVLFGATMFLWECLFCKQLRKEIMYGHDVSQLDELIDKIDQYGPQYIQRVDGQTYVIAKWQQSQQQNVLPLR